MSAPVTPHPGPLAGVRVLELAQIMAGPTAGMMLADLGAEVIKVEKLPGGDDSRGYREPRVNGVSAPFMILNRNKRGIALNLKDERGKEVLRRMVAKADVLTENYRRGTLEKLGLGYEALSTLNPGLIYCAVSGYGTVSMVLAATTGRLAATWCCTRAVPAARPDGLGALVAGSVGRAAALVVTFVVLVGAAVLGQVDDDRALEVSLTLVVAVLVALLVAAVLRRHAVQRFGGVTGDVMGAVVEIATATVLVVVALGSGIDIPGLHLPR